MRRLMLVLAACGTPSAPTPSPSPTPVVAKPDPWDVKADITYSPSPTPSPYQPTARFELARSNEPIALPTSRELVSAMPTFISMIAVTEDGTVAVTADFSRGARIWPSLDGKREPVVVRMLPPTQLAIAKTDEHLVIAGLDAAGGLELVVTKPSGETVRRTAVETPRPFTLIRAVPGGFLALDDEHSLYRVGFEGHISAPLVTDAEEHLATIAVRRDHALAIIERDGKLHGRWIELGTMQFGATTPNLAIGADHVAISPDGKRIAGVARRGKRIAVLDLTTGKFLQKIDAEDESPQRAPVGFVDDKTFVYNDGQGTLIWKRPDSDDGGSTNGDALAVGDGVALSGNGTAMMTMTYDPELGVETSYLGYRMGGPSTLEQKGEGSIVTDGVSIAELDAHFHLRRFFELPKTDRDWYGLRMLDHAHAIAATYSGDGYSLYVIDLENTNAKLLSKAGYVYDYQPATGLLAYINDKTFYIAKFDPKTHAFGTPATLTYSTDRNVHLTLLDPAIAKGNVAAFVKDNDSLTAHVTIIKSFTPGGGYEIDSEKDVQLTAWWWEHVGDISKLVDKRLLQSPRKKSPDGAIGVELGPTRIVATARDGTELWTAPRNGATEVLWTPSGRLIAWGSGIAQLDIATGAYVERQCGWRFGKWDTFAGATGSDLCEAP